MTPARPTDATGKWKQTGIDRDGQARKIFVDGKYEVVSPLTIALDAKDLAPKPITVKVKKADYRSFVGRVTLPDGKPLRR